jgi:hypothetical protein
MSRWRFTKKKENTNAATPTRHMQTPTPSAKWYQHITELPLCRFIDVMVDDNLYALVITGQPAPEDLLNSWIQIRAQYADAAGDNEYKMYVNLMRDVIVLGATLDQIGSIIAALKIVYDQRLVDMLSELMKIKVELDPSDPEKYYKAIAGYVMRSKALKINLDMKQITLDAMAKNMEKGEKPDRGHYQAILVSLSDHAKYHIADNITVFEYCERMRRYVNHLKAEKAKGKTKGGR